MNNILEYLEENINIKKSDSFTQLQVWNNAAFDGEDLTMKTSWSSSDCTKENLSPTALNISSSTSSKTSSKHAKFKNQRNIDEEIAEIESEIRRLTSRLEALRLEKSDRKIASEKRVGVGGRVVAAKFMEPKRRHSVVPNKITEDTPIRNAVVSNKVAENTPKRNAVVFKDVTPKRNVVVSKDDTPNNNKVSRINWRRGMSLGPVEIAGRVPPATTPATQSRRKSCFWKPQEEIDEQRRKTICKANTVGGAIKRVKKKEEEMVQPRNLFFKEAETEKSKSACVSNNNKKVLKQGRVVASRYNSGGGDVRKRSFPEKGGSEVRMKKRWEIPVEDVDVSGFVLLPKISTLRCVNESPRDSGAAKRVAELTGKKSYFCHDDEEEGSACQVLSFAEDDAE